jgi:teichuronic acid biosynthesis glycosyltransferase TuaG
MDNTFPLISVIVTTYNRRELLSETISSILSQSYRNIEIIVVDNYSQYEFFEEVQSFQDERIRCYQNQNSGIIAVNRNFGIRKARGNYIAFCDDDDIWNPDKLELQLEHLKVKGTIGVGSQVTFIGESRHYRKKRKYTEEYVIFDNVVDGNVIPLSTIIVKNIGDLYFDENPLLIGYEDWDFQINILCRHKTSKIIILPLETVLYRVHENNSSLEHRDDNVPLYIINKYKGELSKVGYDNALSRIYYRGAVFAAKQYSFSIARAKIRAAFNHTSSIGFIVKCIILSIYISIPIALQKLIISFHYRR